MKTLCLKTNLSNAKPCDLCLTRFQKKYYQLHSDAQLIPKKTYLSYTAAREFAAMNIKPKELRIGMDLGDMAFTDSLQKSKLSGPMPRISHMFVITDLKQFDKQLIEYLQLSYNRTHKK